MSAPDSVGEQQLSIVIVGHVDHGKSTVIGRLLSDTGSLPTGKLEQVRATCERNSKPFEYAFLLDALKDEQSQGITIDVARVFFRTALRRYIIIDAPGHIEFLKNMITGAARADAALLVIDAHEGIQENSRRHGYLLSFLGIRQVVVLINKMDLVGFDHGHFERLRREYSAFLAEQGVQAADYIPVAAMAGENIAARSSQMPWYEGPTVLQALDAFEAAKQPEGLPFRMPVQDVYKFTSRGDDRRIVAGTIESGTLSVGDPLVFLPSGKRSTVKSIEAFNAAPGATVPAGAATGFTLTEQIYATRGQIAVRANERPCRVATRLRVSIFWLGRQPLVLKKEYGFRLATARTTMRLETIVRVIDASQPNEPTTKDRIDRHEVAECVLSLSHPVAFDLPSEVPALSRFVIIDDYEIAGGGIIQEALEDRVSWVREKVLVRNYRWETSMVSQERRSEKYSQRASLVLVTGTQASRRKEVAKALEHRLFEDGRIVYYLGMGSLKYGVDADLSGDRDTRQEHVRRLAEIAHIMLDIGAILIVSAQELSQADLEIVRTVVEPDFIEVVWLDEEVTTDCSFDLKVVARSDDDAVSQIKSHLQKRGALFRPFIGS